MFAKILSDDSIELEDASPAQNTNVLDFGTIPATMTHKQKKKRGTEDIMLQLCQMLAMQTSWLMRICAAKGSFFKTFHATN